MKAEAKAIHSQKAKEPVFVKANGRSESCMARLPATAVAIPAKHRERQAAEAKKSGTVSGKRRR